jgi:Raf kinase inhibitor-like YbhB/YbcL family protein
MSSIASLAGRLLRPLRAGSEELAEGKIESGKPGSGALRIASDTFGDRKPIPELYAGKSGRSPELHFSGIPSETKEIVLICEDPDAPTPKPFVHWLVYHLPPDVHQIEEGDSDMTLLPAGARVGKNSLGTERYFGPAPPPGHGTHHYHFQLFALDTKLQLSGAVDRDQIVSAMRDHVLAYGETIGTFERV